MLAMLFKISARNIRRSMRDYAIYFFTLIIGVSIFYVFNAIGGQAAMMQVDESTHEIVALLADVITATSIFVALVLAFLIIYASRFLMKRRNNEFAIYMMLGMSKRKISAILLVETIMIGIGSLFVGLLIGVGFSQLMSAIVANLFEADMTNYQFTISYDAIGMTVFFFAVMYIAVMIFNSGAVTKMKLIDLMQSGKKSETVRLRNPVLCVIIFILSAVALGYAYYKVAFPYEMIEPTDLWIYIAIGCVTTFFIFWSVSGLLLRIVMSIKKIYNKGLNTFTFRQISSRVNTMVFSMTIICLMLFLTICALTSAFSLRNSMNKNAETLCPADVEVEFEQVYLDGEPIYENKRKMMDDIGFKPDEVFTEYVQYSFYRDDNFGFPEFLGDKYEKIRAEKPRVIFNFMEKIVPLSEYNELMRFFGGEEISLGSDEYALVCDFSQMLEIRDEVLADKPDVTIFGKTLHSKYDKCVYGFMSIGVEHTNTGIYVVPDETVDSVDPMRTIVVGKHGITDKKERREKDREIVISYKKAFSDLADRLRAENPDKNVTEYFYITSKSEILTATVGIGAVITFLGLYIGMVFLIACGALLALKELSGSVDSITRYEMLRKIGAEERDITFSLFKQTGVFFLMPLLLAIVHSIFGMKFANLVLEAFGTDELARSIALTSGILLLIYGGYFLITFLSSKRIVREMPGKTE